MMKQIEAKIMNNLNSKIKKKTIQEEKIDVESF